MNKTPKQQPDMISFDVIERGTLAGLWYVPADGFAWRDDVQPLVPSRDLAQAQPVLDGWQVGGEPPPGSDDDDCRSWLVPRGDLTVRYPVLHKRRLLSAFDRLSERPTRERILRFAERYGWLGRPHDVGAVGEPIQQGEPISLWRQQLVAFRDLRETWRHVCILQNADQYGLSLERAARKYLQERVKWRSDRWVIYRSRREDGESRRDAHAELVTAVKAYRQGKIDQAAYGRAAARHMRLCARAVLTATWEPDSQADMSELAPGDLIGPARRYVFHEVAARLQRQVSPVLLAFERPIIRYAPEDLLAAIYMLFAWELVGVDSGKPESECLHCHTLFRPRRRDQRYCSKNCRELYGYHRRKAQAGARSSVSEDLR